MGHATVAFNQGQVHSILRAVSTETITSSLHQMKNILEEAIRVGIRSQCTTQGPGKQRIKCFRKQADSHGPDGQDSDVGTEGYTSGALSSEDKFVINSQRTGEELSIISPPSPSGQGSSSTPGPTSMHQVPSPGFCSADYEPLATLTTDQASASSPPRKRRQLPGRSGKIMKGPISKESNGPHVCYWPTRPGAQQTQILLPNMQDECFKILERCPGDRSSFPVRIPLP